MRPDMLSKAMETVFKQLKPRIVVITTPNNEFNIVFNDLNHVRTEFSRDHKIKYLNQNIQQLHNRDIYSIAYHTIF